jgi:hypothetical protein
MPKFITSIDLSKNELRNFAVQNLASAPATPVEGQMYYNTTDDKLYYRTASSWVAIEAAAGSYTLPVATTVVLGGVKDGAGITIDAGGVVSVDYGTALNTATQGNDPRVTADQAAGTASIRTIGTGALQAAAGNHGHTIDALSNVVITSNSDNEILSWDSATSKWINQTAEEAGLSISSHTHTNDHVAVTVTDSTTIDFTLTGQDITASVIFGVTATTVAQGNHTHTNDHIATTVTDTTSIDLTITGQQISAAAIFGATAGTIAEGNHTHTALGNLTITGNLIVNGTTTTINTTELAVSDNIIIVNNDVTGVPSENGGLEVERGTSTNVSILWNETSDTWTLTNNGTNFFGIAHKFVSTFGDGAATSFVITHNLNTRDLSVSIRRTGTPYDIVMADVECTSLTAITIYTAAAPTSGEYTVSIQG